MRERFHRGEHLFSTRTAECFRATDKASGKKVSLWLLRFPLIAESEEASYFVRRLKRIAQLDFSKPQIIGGGVDNSGVAYLVTESVSGYPLVKTGVDTAKNMRWFGDIVKAVSVLHQNGIFLGDISQDTFIVNEQQRVLAVGLMGTFEAAARQTAMLPPRETFHYVAPEQRSGSSPDIASDVYALGVYGYRLLTGRYLTVGKVVSGSVDNPVDTAPAPSSLRPDLPRWIDAILRRCLETNPNDRYSDAAELLRSMEAAQDTQLSPLGDTGWTKQVPPVKKRKNRPQKLTQIGNRESLVPVKAMNITPAVRSRKWLTAEQERLLMIFLIVCGVAGGAALAYYLSGLQLRSGTGGSLTGSSDPRAGGGGKGGEEGTVVEGIEATSLRFDSAPAELKPFLARLKANDLPPVEREQALMQLGQSENRFAYRWLVKVAYTPLEPSLRLSAQRLVISRLRRDKLEHAADVISRWLDSERQAGKDSARSTAYVLLLWACDNSRSFESRKNGLLRAFTMLPKISLQVAAALALDESQEKFTPVLRQMLSSELPGQDLSGLGIGALLFSYPALKVFLSQDVSLLFGKFSDEDLRWTARHATRGDTGIFAALAKEIINRKMLSPYESVFLEPMTRYGTLEMPETVRQGLIKAAMGQINEEQVDSFARWESPYSEAVLYAVCAAAKEESVGQDAFDILAGRVLVMEPGASLVKWVKSRYWDYRLKLLKAIGILAFVNQASTADLDYSFTALKPFMSSGLLRVLLSTSNSQLIRQTLQRFGSGMDANDLLPLLSNSYDKQVRIAAVEALKGHVELVVLQAILRAYAKEQDPEVREIYRQSHWVTREKETPPT